jgi:hypothetical protein
MGTRSTLLSFVGGILLALSLALLASNLRERSACGVGGCDDRLAMPAPLPSPLLRPRDANSTDVRPSDGTAAGGVYVMHVDDPAERALAEARRAAASGVGNAPSDIVITDRRPEIAIAEGPHASAESAPAIAVDATAARDATAPDDIAAAAPATIASATPSLRAHARRDADRVAMRDDAGASAPLVARPRARETEGRARRRAGSPDLGGWWVVTNSIESTDYPAYEGLRLVYRVRLRHEGDRVVGQGEKWLENGRPVPPWQRTPIFVSGTIRDGRLEMRFVEHGRRRTSEGRFVLALSPDAAHLDGRFASTVANTSGRSEAQRM